MSNFCRGGYDPKTVKSKKIGHSAVPSCCLGAVICSCPTAALGFRYLEYSYVVNITVVG